MLQMNAYKPGSSIAPMVQNEEHKELHVNEMVEGKVIAFDGMTVFVDLPPYGTGIIFGREFINSKDIIKNLAVGDVVKAKVIERENEEGYIEISLKEARQALLWREAEQAIKTKTKFTLPVRAANKGGLIISWHGIEGFLPASQLTPDHYPQVEDGNKDDILRELKKFVGEQLTVNIISINPKEGKMIFSEKSGNVTEKLEILTSYAVGDEMECEVTGVVDFGIFVKLEDGLEGLVHISEIDWSLVEDISKLYKVGDKVTARIIEIKESKVSLSIKAMKPNPWETAKTKYSVDSEVQGVVMKFTKHGALIAVEEGISGLVHVSEFGSEEEMKKTLGIGKMFTFKVELFNPNEQRMALSFVK